LYPSFLAGPFGDVPAELWRDWLSGVVELHPLWPIGADPARTGYFLGAALLGAPIALWAALRSEAHDRPSWWFVAGSLVVTVVLGLMQLRLSAFAQILATFPWAWATGRVLARVGEGRRLGLSIARVGAMIVGVAGFLAPVLLVLLIPSATTAPSGPAEECAALN
jgi:hypothetical protein